MGELGTLLKEERHMKKNNIIDYGVESSNALKNLVERVNGKIRKGWQPLEWCTLGTDRLENREYTQTMVRYEAQKRRIVGYHVEYSIGEEDFINKVKSRISAYWQPVGPCISVRDDSGKIDRYQTMVLYEDAEKAADTDADE